MRRWEECGNEEAVTLCKVGLLPRHVLAWLRKATKILSRDIW
jgi:hypothetical protein